MTGEMPGDFDQATAITMQAYREIAGDYAQRHQISKQPSFWQACLQLFAEHARVARARQDPALPILDVGCGPGRDSLLLAREGLDVLAIDLSEAMLAEARLRCLDQPGAERIDFRHMDMRHLELADASSAGIWSSASFLHIPKRDSNAVLQEMARVLTPGSPLLLIVKEVDGGADERYESILANSPPRFFARYNGGELWALLEGAGLRVLSLNTEPDKRYTNGQRWLAALAQKCE